jgi:uncharacterized protein YjbI with pentapeptide repeats
MQLALYDRQGNLVLKDLNATDYSTFIKDSMQKLHDVVGVNFDQTITNIEIKDKVFVDCTFYTLEDVTFNNCEFHHSVFIEVERCLFENSILANSKFTLQIKDNAFKECVASDVIFERGIADSALEECTFKRCGFSVLSEVTFDRCDFDWCAEFTENLTNVSFDRSCFSRQAFLDLCLRNCNFAEVKGDLFFDKCIFMDINFVSAALEYNRYLQCQFFNVSYDRSIVSASTYENCKMCKTSWQDVDLDSTSYDECYFSDSNFTGAKNILDLVTFQPSVIINDDCLFDVFPSNVRKVSLSLKGISNAVNNKPFVQQSASVPQSPSGGKPFWQKYPNICPSCGNPAYQGLTGWLCANQKCVFADKG